MGKTLFEKIWDRHLVAMSLLIEEKEYSFICKNIHLMYKNVNCIYV